MIFICYEKCGTCRKAKAWLEEKGKTLDELLKMGWDVGVAWQDGRQHGGAQHIRLNLALPLSRVQEALARMDKYVFTK